MPADRLLGTLLRALQTWLLGTAASLLTTLNNPLNVTLLASQLLSAPAIWAQPDGLRTCMRSLSVFHSAAQALIRHEVALKEKSPSDPDFQQLQLERTLPKDDWIRAAVAGADEHSPRWRHLLILGGLLLGFGAAEDEHLSHPMRSTLESGLVAASNASLEEMAEGDDLGQETIALVLNHCFPITSDHERARLDYDRLLPVLMRSVLHLPEGLRSAYFLGALDIDVQQVSNSQFQWSERTQSFQLIQTMLASPLISSLGPLARLIGHTIEQVKDQQLVLAAVDDIEGFVRTLYLQWRQLKLSEIDASEEAMYLDNETLYKTTPALWKLLRSTMFALVIVLRSVVGRILGDRMLSSSGVASGLAAQTLHILRYLYFISSRQGGATFSQYTFVYLTAMDILAAHPRECEAFVDQTKPAEPGQVPQHPLDRTFDLFFLNTAENFTPVVPSRVSEDQLVAAAAPYLAAGGNNNLLPIFEAAHSVMLACFSAPQNVDLTFRHLPFYIDALFKVFPSNLSARQFRLAFKTLMRLTTPPSALAYHQPMLPATLLELLNERARNASTVPLFPQPTSQDPDAPPEAVMELSEQAVVVLTVLDTLTQLPLALLDEWLPVSAELVNYIEDAAMREHCKEHFWHMLIDGEMDPGRSELCAAWWNTSGGREMVLYGREDEQQHVAEMSGALSVPGSESKL
ncbi:hypothetical protein D0865_06697 [Hortaea werneckii]|uniref:Peroxisomal membrane protein PEX17 n=1 Tax=Hortaea werneckii TaxID=91943 RepID=A0A3M7CFA1_HORWE|nr:hypothetical protein D0865_06697 [Hortaea werneckii]